MNDFITSLIRTYVPYIVGGVASFLATRGIDLDAEASAALGTFLTLTFGSVYYAVVRKIEAVRPDLGVLLGVAKKPEYTE